MVNRLHVRDKESGSVPYRICIIGFPSLNKWLVMPGQLSTSRSIKVFGRAGRLVRAPHVLIFRKVNVLGSAGRLVIPAQLWTQRRVSELGSCGKVVSPGQLSTKR